MDYETIKRWEFPDVVQRYDKRDAMLYALAVGYGFDPLDVQQLRYVVEDQLLVAPSLAAILGYPGFWMRDEQTGIDWVRVVHAEQALTIHRPLAPAGAIVGRTRVKAIVDKGPDKGALIYQERTVTDEASGELLATVEPTNLCRGDGGLSRSDDPPEPIPPLPTREPDDVCELPTLPQAALLYRLLGDVNPLHASPDAAVRAGFERPILHGLATFGVAMHAILRTYGNYDPGQLRHLSARFSAPVYPGETIRTELWRSDDAIRFRSKVVERDLVVLTNGLARLSS
jgi:acyl dehydratase